ncbi:hypothetical protein JMJ35_004880 [Cladonia borealis]|uniref:Uncharacterized protein n=1 Tax=Cladonia borealis TaxID=184061 RepID=A0AA39V1Z1_9LECA|nr:hypothetical protein JMJ35_004880 [Cladonia borealis]
MSENNNAGQMGWMEPVLYDIGLTHGQPGKADIYDACLNGIQSGTNGAFTAVASHDLVRGLGSPKSGLIFQLTSPEPPVPVEFNWIRFIVGTGDDNLRNDSTATAKVTLVNGHFFTVTLKAKDHGSLANGSTQLPLDFFIRHNVPTLPTPTQALAGVQINLFQGGSFPETAENWVVATLQVSLFNTRQPQFCQLDLVGSSKLQDGSTGLVRLSESAGPSGNGPSSPVYQPGPASGC